MELDRPFLTYDKQIDKLENKYKLIINDKDFAIHALSTISYYDLINGYKNVFIKNETFIPDTTIEYLYTFRLFDIGFQTILFKQSTFIENLFKTKLSYVLAESFGSDTQNYLSESNFYEKKGDIDRDDLLSNIKDIYTGEYIQQPTKHYLKNHNHIPPWILFKNVSFGNCINLYRLLKPNQKHAITDSMLTSTRIDYGKKVDFLTNALNIIRLFRNKIAHNLKFVTYKSKNKLAPSTVTKILPGTLINWKDIKKNQGINDIYSMILSIISLLDNDYLISEFLKEILIHICPQDLYDENELIKSTLFEDYKIITNLPINLEEKITTYLKQISK